MSSLLNDALEWLERAEQARVVAGQLANPTEKKAILHLAESYEQLARAAATPTVLRRRELAIQGRAITAASGSAARSSRKTAFGG